MDEQLTESTGWADFRSRSTTDDVDPWAWTEQRSAGAAEVDLSHCRVTAVLVTLDAEEWLPDTLAGLARLEPPPTRLIAIDNASTDSTPSAAAASTRSRPRSTPSTTASAATASVPPCPPRWPQTGKRAPAERGSDRGTRLAVAPARRRGAGPGRAARPC